MARRTHTILFCLRVQLYKLAKPFELENHGISKNRPKPNVEKYRAELFGVTLAKQNRLPPTDVLPKINVFRRRLSAVRNRRRSFETETWRVVCPEIASRRTPLARTEGVRKSFVPSAKCRMFKQRPKTNAEKWSKQVAAYFDRWRPFTRARVSRHWNGRRFKWFFFNQAPTIQHCDRKTIPKRFRSF